MNSVHQQNEFTLKTRRSNILRLLAYFKPYWKQIVVSTFLALLINTAIIAKPYIFKLVIDNHIVKKDFNTHAILLLGLLYVGVVFFGSFVTYVQSLLLIWVGQKITFTIRSSIFAHIQSMSLSFFDKNSTGRLLTRITNDVEGVNELFSGMVINIFRDSVMLIGIIITMFTLNVQLALISIGCVPVIAIVSIIYRIAARKNFIKVKGMIARINGFLAENISGMKLVQIFHREKEKHIELKNLDKDYFRYSFRAVILNGFSRPLVDVINNVTIAMLLLFSTQYIDKSVVTVGVLFAFISYIREFFEPISALSEQYTTMQSAIISSERIFEILDTDATVENFSSGIPCTKLSGEIEFCNVWFAYDKEEWILKDISFKIKPAENVAFVGATGSGKTTIIRLITRFYSIQKGTILIDGIDIRKYNLRDLRQQIAVVMQEGFLFAGDLRFNIRLNNKAIDDQGVTNALQSIYAHDFLKSLPGGINERVYERGCTFSSGQKQLISFARAVAYSPSILILDEATATIDTHTESAIQKGMEVLCKDRTSIIIAHRLSTINNVDRIIVLHEGAILETGTHRELLDCNGVYAQMYSKQIAG